MIDAAQVILEVHYDNPGLVANHEDTMGFEAYAIPHTCLALPALASALLLAAAPRLRSPLG